MIRGSFEHVTGTVIAVNQAPDKTALSRALTQGFRALGFNAYRLGCHKKDRRDWIMHPTLSSCTEDAGTPEIGCWPGSESDLDEATDIAWPDGRPASGRILKAQVGRRGVTIPLRNRPGTISALAVEAGAGDPPRELIGALAIIGNAAQLKAEALGLCAEGPDPDSPLHLLTDKQREILLWAAQGKSTSDIAAIMTVKERTVKYHFDEILRKLQVRTRTQAVAMLAKAA